MSNTKWRVEKRHAESKPWAVVHPSGVVITYHETWDDAWAWLRVYLDPEVTVEISQRWSDLAYVIEIKGDPIRWKRLVKTDN